MKRFLSILFLSVVLVITLVVPAQAHEDENQDDNPTVPNSCESKLTALSDLFVEYDLWKYTDRAILHHTDPEHELFHSGEFSGVFRGIEVLPISPIFPITPTNPDYSINTGDGCHHLEPVGWCRRCTKYVDSERDDHEPVCVSWRVWACVYHLPHCPGVPTDD